jgi:hypothetical protein
VTAATEIRILRGEDGKLSLSYGGVPTSEFSPNESLVQYLEREIAGWRLEKDKPHRNADPWSGKHADTLQELLDSLKQSKK